jgi:hypothetical protein
MSSPLKSDAIAKPDATQSSDGANVEGSRTPQAPTQLVFTDEFMSLLRDSCVELRDMIDTLYVQLPTPRDSVSATVELMLSVVERAPSEGAHQFDRADSIAIQHGLSSSLVLFERFRAMATELELELHDVLLDDFTKIVSELSAMVDSGLPLTAHQTRAGVN